MTVELDQIRVDWHERVDERLQEAVTSSGEQLLMQMNSFHMNTGGKRLRALIPIWVCVNAGGEPETALELGVGLELIHNATLIHDDLQDGDEVRRGQPTVWRRWGAAQAINAGDALYFHGIQRILRSPAGPEVALAASDALVRVIAGQVMEFRLQLDASDENALAPTVSHWEQMARGKTGALFGVCCLAGALASGRPDAASDAMSYGTDLGLFFQVQDDLLDLVGDKGRGTLGSDIAEGKRSYPVVWALTHGDRMAAERILEIVSTPREETTESMVDDAIATLIHMGAIEATIRWLRAGGDALRSHPLAPLTPGIVEAVLRPIAHAL
ncbi:MAG: hypothetical protein CL940_04320 [Deltaproteobacteria bacterium]|nr:hypothetical protein [Deltaproteobacteria bacterium]